MLGMNRKRLSHILGILQRENLVIRFVNEQAGRNNAVCYQPGVTPAKTKIRDLIPLFYDSRDFVVFEEELNNLIKTLDIHPGFLLEDITLQDLLKKPGTILDNLQKVNRNITTELHVDQDDKD